MIKYRAVQRDGLWVLQERIYLFFWRDVHIRCVLINAKQYPFFLGTLYTTLNYKFTEIIPKDDGRVYFKR